MSEKPEKDDEEHEVLQTFDMYHFFSRKDVILVIIFLLIILAIVLFNAIMTPAVV